MAKKTDSAAELPERIYTVPLRGEWLRGPRIKRAGRSVAAIRKFLSRHMKVGTVKISEKLNEQLWARGLKKPPASIKVKAQMNEEGIVTARLPDEVVVKEEEKSKMEKLKEKLGGGKEAEAPKEAEAKEEPKQEGEKAEEKKEVPKEGEASKEEEKPKEPEVKLEEEKPEEDPKPEEEKPEEKPKEKEEEEEKPLEDDDEIESPTYKEVHTKFPTLFKEFPNLRHTIFREQEYTKLYPTVEDAKDAKDKGIDQEDIIKQDDQEQKEVEPEEEQL